MADMIFLIRKSVIAGGCVLMACALLAGVSVLAQAPEVGVAASIFERLESRHLPNAIRVHHSLICGGLPADQRAFAELQQLGVQTIISVDGAQPDVEVARQFGLRYVHLPHGYDGISEERVRALTKALRELPGPIYMHCHHGHHRSPAAAAVASISAGLIQPADGLELLDQAGTSRNYRGLYAATREAQVIPEAETSQLKIVFEERAAVPPMAAAMVSLEHTFDNLKRLAAAHWGPLPAHPDIDARHEALLLREHFAELLRIEGAATQRPAFQSLLREGLQWAEQLEAGLDLPVSRLSPESEHLPRIMQGLTDNCRHCHTQFRDVPHLE